MNQSLIRDRLLSGGLWAFGGRVLTIVLGLVINAMLARLLSPKEVGAYFLIFSVVTFGALLAQMGMMRTVVRLVSESLGVDKPGRARAALLKIFSIAAFMASLGALFLSLLPGKWMMQNLFKSPLMGDLSALAALWMVVLVFKTLIAESFRGFGDIMKASLFEQFLTSAIAATILALLWLLAGNSELEQVLIVLVFAGGLSVIIGALLLARRVVALQGEAEKVGIQEILSVSFPLLVASLAPIIFSQCPIWVLGALKSENDVAIYGAVVRLVTLVSLPLLVVNAVVSPIIAELYVQGRHTELEGHLRTTATIAAIPCLAILLFFICLGPSTLEIVYGDFYRSGFPVMAMLCVGKVVNVWTGSCGITLMMTGHEKSLMKIVVLSAVLVAGGSAWTVARFGLIGLATLVSFTNGLQYILLLLAARRYTGMWTHARLAIPSVSMLKRIRGRSG